MKIKSPIAVIKEPYKIIHFLGKKGLLNWMPDEMYLKLIYKGITGKKLNLETPKGFNEKIQWLKLYDHNPMYHNLVDKYEVRKYVKEKIGEQYLVPLIGVYETVDQIPFNQLPEQYVLKCTHDSGTIIIKNKTCKLNIEEVKKKLNNSLQRNYYYEHREWPYKKVKPRIICEEYLVDETGFELKDYKVFCFDGKPKLIQVDYDRFINHRRNLYNIQWSYIEASIQYPNDPTKIIPKPLKLDDILRCANILSRGIPHVRVDFYSINEKVYFGEITFYHGAGFEKFLPKSLELEMGSWIILPN